MSINATIIVQAVIFLFFILFTMKFVWPPVIKALETRRAKIAEGLSAAEKGTLALHKAKADAEAIINQARNQAATILRQVNEQAALLADEARENALKESQLIISAARNEIEVEARAAREQLREELSNLVIMGVEKVLNAEIDAKPHKDLLGSLAVAWSRQ